MDNDWTIKVATRPAFDVLDIWVIKKTFNGVCVLIPGQNSIWTEQNFDRGVEIPTSLSIPQYLSPVLMKALSDQGVKLPDESFVKGKLEATQEHLKDLRQLLKLKN